MVSPGTLAAEPSGMYTWLWRAEVNTRIHVRTFSSKVNTTVMNCACRHLPACGRPQLGPANSPSAARVRGRRAMTEDRAVLPPDGGIDKIDKILCSVASRDSCTYSAKPNHLIFSILSLTRPHDRHQAQLRQPKGFTPKFPPCPSVYPPPRSQCCCRRYRQALSDARNRDARLELPQTWPTYTRTRMHPSSLLPCPAPTHLPDVERP